MSGPAVDLEAAPADRYCDLVMKGGITSGIVYPAAIDRLRKHYRFKSIGGTSAGAIAAAVTAAAEYQRRQAPHSEAGFDLLAGLPDELGGPSVRPGISRLLALFQPQPSTRRLFAVLRYSLNSKSTGRRWVALLLGFCRAYWPAVVVALLIAMAIFYTAGTVAALLATPMAMAALIAAWVYRDLTQSVVANHYGLCSGMSDPSSGDLGPALTPWLHERIQAAAGRDVLAEPLTFGDLWSAPGFPPSWISATKVRSIDLQMFSTNLAHGRPYIFPIDEDDLGQPRERLFYKREELEPLLPAELLAWMWERSEAYTVATGREGVDPDIVKGSGLRTLPRAQHFPVLLAARMSLSFPLLLSAVPLWAIDDSLPRGQRAFRRCWFSDGGISSNFPMHLFDGLVPMWPTFGISLEPRQARGDDVYVPRHYGEGYDERWSGFDEKSASAGRFGGFLGAVVGAMQNWNDNMLSRMPGVRDRVARVRLDPHEGGMNLNMEPDIIQGVARRGGSAADALVDRFRNGTGWDEHRLVRLNVLLKMIEARAPAVITGLGGSLGHATDYQTIVDHARTEAPPGYDAPMDDAQARDLQAVIEQVTVIMRQLQSGMASNTFVPVPRPELRVRPPL